jgi:hypothetical protein
MLRVATSQAEAARAVIHAGKRLWWAAVGVAYISALLKLVVDLPARGESLTRALMAVPFFGALAVPLTWLAYRWLPCSCTLNERGFRFRGRYAGHYHLTRSSRTHSRRFPLCPATSFLPCEAPTGRELSASLSFLQLTTTHCERHLARSPANHSLQRKARLRLAAAELNR